MRYFDFVQTLEKHFGYPEAWTHPAHCLGQALRLQPRPSQSLQHSGRAVESGVLEAVEEVLADEGADERLLSFSLVSVVRVQSESERAGNMNGVCEFASDPIPSVVQQRERGERRRVSA